MKHLKLFNSFVNEELNESEIPKDVVKKLPTETQKRLAQNIKGNSSLSKINEDWGSSDQGIMNKAIHRDLGNPTKFMSPFDSKLRSAAEDAVDFWWNEWPEYKKDKEGLIDNAIRAYYRAYFPKEFAGFTKMFNESVVSEGAHGMATKLLQGIVDGDSSKAEDFKMSKELAQHFIDWIRTSPYGKKNGNLPLDMLVKASFNWGIERGLDPKLKSELAGLKETLKESIDFEDEDAIDEGVVSIKGGRILAHKVLNKLVDMEIIPVKKKSEEAIEAVASVLATTSMSESIDESFEVHYSDGIRQMKKFGSESQAISFAKDLIKSKKGLQHVDVFNAGSNFNSTADTDALVAWWGDGSFMDNKSKNDPKLAAKKIDESVELNEGAVKKFESDIASIVKNIKSGYGWIDPEYIEETWDNIATSIDFGIAAEEICNRLIKAGLVYFPDNNDAEEKGKQVKNYSEIAKLVESLNEGAVQIAGKNKPSGAKVLATIIVDDLMKKDYLKPGADKVKTYLVDDVQDVIMNNTF